MVSGWHRRTASSLHQQVHARLIRRRGTDQSPRRGSRRVSGRAQACRSTRRAAHAGRKRRPGATGQPTACLYWAELHFGLVATGPPIPAERPKPVSGRASRISTLPRLGFVVSRLAASSATESRLSAASGLSSAIHSAAARNSRSALGVKRSAVIFSGRAQPQLLLEPHARRPLQTKTLPVALCPQLAPGM